MIDSAEGYQISPQQRHLWRLLGGQGGRAGAARTRVLLRLDGPLDAAALSRAVDLLVARYEILRTNLALAEGLAVPLQRVEPAGPRLLQLATAPGAIELAELVRGFWPEAENNTSEENLAPGFLLRSAGPELHLLGLDYPALLLDGQSMESLVGELLLSLEALSAEAASQEQQVVLQYADLSAWLSGLLEDGEEARREWRRGGLWERSRSILPGERPAELDAVFCPAEVRLKDCGRLLEEVAAALQLSAESLLLTAWATFLSRGVGAEVVVGVHVDGRNYAELEAALGLFEKNLPVVVAARPRSPFDQLAAEVAQSLAQAYEVQEYFVWDDVLPADHDPALAFWPLAFRWREGQDTWPVGRRRAQLLARRECDGRFHLQLAARRRSEGLELTLRFARERFSATEAGRLAHQFEVFLAAVLAAPATPLVAVPRLSAADHQRLLVEANDTAMAVPDEASLGDWFRCHVRRTPEATALCFEERSWTYRELAATVADLARRLRASGVGPEVAVGLYLDRGPEALLALLAVLEAGGFYVPLEPGQPADRLALVREQVAPRLLLSVERLSSEPGFAALSELERLWLDGWLEGGEEKPAGNDEASPAPPPDALAYVLFTSGSTGRPKGVAVSRRQLFAYTSAVVSRLALPPAASFANVSSLAADLGNTAIFAALWTGGALHLISRERVLDATLFASYGAEHAFGGLKIVPSHLSALLAGAEAALLLPRKWLVFGGEALNWELVARVRERAPELVIFNHYGPTETTVGALAGRVAPNRFPDQVATVPLGRPLPSYRALVLNGELEPLPEWQVGELFLGGVGVARGYHGAAAETAKRFLPDPYALEPGGRFYRTGDRVRRLPDGTIEFLGRGDLQVKLRGFRIELGEVETTLSRHPAVGAAVVMVRADGGADPRLVAFFVRSQRETALEAADLAAFVARQLPDFMVPTVWVELPSLPLTSNGKVDRTTLLRSSLAAIAPAPSGREPSTHVEQLLAALWAEILGRPAVRAEDDFFALGGHSLAATRLVAGIGQAFGLEISLPTVFEHARLEDLANEIERAMAAGLGAQRAPLAPASPGAPRQLSFAQERLWFLQQLEPASPAYNVGGGVRLVGALVVRSLARALTAVVARHEVLRSAYPAVEGTPRVVVEAPRPLLAPLVDLSALGANASGCALAISACENRLPLNVASAPLLRVLLLRLAAEDHVLLITVHHMVADAWSRMLFVRELREHYHAAGRAEPAQLPALGLQYGDFAAWQRQELAGEVLSVPLAYWRRQLSDLPPLELPTDRPRPAQQTYHGARLAFALPRSLAAALTALARGRGLTPFMLLAAAFEALLLRFTGSRRFALGTPTLTRGRAGTEDLIGLFLDMVVLRAQLEPALPFAALLAGVRSTLLAALAHQLPFEKLVEELAPERQLSQTPLFQVMFTLQSLEAESLTLPGVKVEAFGAPPVTAKFDLTLFLEQRGETFAGLVEYRSDLFDRTSMARFLGWYSRLVASAVEAPERAVGELELLSPAERRQLVGEWNDRELPAGRADESLGTLLTRAAEGAPERIAVAADSSCLSYAELEAWSLEVAAELMARGLEPGEVVAVALGRGLELPAALLGVLRSGAAYLPLDLSLPAARLEYTLADCGAALILTTAELKERLPASELPCLLIGRGAAQSGSAARLPPEPDAAELAYVIYTSGSTGQPKGVEVCRQGLASFLCAMARQPGLGAADRLLAVTTLAFDIAALELYLPLARGAQVVLASREQASDGRALAALLAVSAATVMQATPATWRLLLEAGWQGQGGLRAMCGGEALTGDLAAALLPRVEELWNVYGPTETTVWSTVERVRRASPPIALGRPIAGTSLQILDRSFEPLPLGAIGGLYIGGLGLARGYRRRPALTAERFRPDPWGPPGSRLYVTGDRARRSADGRLLFLGRDDHQVKIRGFRLELGEIEAHLLAQPTVADAVVAVDAERVGGAVLVAFVVAGLATDGEAPTTFTAALAAALKTKLPEPMIPADWVVLAELPRTASGKVDRKALPLEQARRRGATDVELPRTAFEERLALLWQEVLAVELVGVGDNFFALGGHSLLATRLMFRVSAELGIDAPLQLLFEQPELGAFASALETRREAGGSGPSLTSLPAIVADLASRFEPFPLNDMQHAYWIGRSSAFELGNVASHSYRELALPGLEVERFELALRRLVARHDMLRAVVSPDGQQQILRQVPPYVVTRLDLTGRPAEEQAAALAAVRAEMSHQVLPTDRWPLFEVRATLLDGGLVHLHFSLDYLIADGWSVPLLGRDLARFYQDPELELPPLELSFRDCVLAERAHRDSAVFERSRAYWQTRLEELPPAPELPLVKSFAALGQPRFVRRSGALDAARWSRLQRRGAEHGLTATGVLLAAFTEVLARWSKSPRFTLNVTLFNRLPLHSQIYDLVGDFTSLTLLAVDAGAQEPFRERARRLQHRLWEDLEHRLAGGIAVLRELARRRGRSAEALMPVVFTSFLIRRRAGAEPPPQAAESGAAGEGGGMVFNITQTPQVWLDHQVTESDGELRFHWDVVEELLPPGLLADLFAAYRDLLLALAEGEESWEKVSPTTLPAVQRQLLADYNQTEAALPVGRLHDGFFIQSQRQPERPAIFDRRRVLCYGELAGAAEGLATRLADGGVGLGDRVGIVMEKGWEQVAAVLAVLRAGAAYVPIDAALPAERVALLCRRCGIRVVVTQPWIETRLEWPAGVERLVLTADDPPGATAPASLPRPGAEALAYVIFTSGSTGEPKGVAIDHRGAANTVADMNRRFAIGADDRVLALSSLSFDLSVWDIFGILGAGGALVLPEPTAGRDPSRWLELLRQHQVTIWNSVPALLEMLVTHAPAAAFLALRWLWLSGDWIPVSLPARLKALAPRAEVISLGGATEASIWSILHPIVAADQARPSIPYGRPMANQRFFVLDERFEPRPLWVPGQLYIAGVGLAQGYFGDGELSAARFPRHPDTGERLYATGDLGRMLPEGEIEFLGREDAQVKIQGFRVELGEVESVLERHARVRAAAVAPLGEEKSRRGLVAYVVRANEEAEDEDLVSILQAHCAAQLPAYMVPMTVMFLPRLPLTTNGKLDRRALPEPGGALVSRPAEPPRSPLELQLAAVWRLVLGVEQVHLGDNFFDLGGNSVSLVQVHGRLQELFEREIPIVDLFAHPSLRALADKLASTGTPHPAAAENEATDQEQLRAESRLARRGRRRPNETQDREDLDG